MADVCNHSWTPECGYYINASEYRLFLDACDMYEYNCDKFKGNKVIHNMIFFH